MTFQRAFGYPLHRPRRLRGHPRLRDMLSENRLTVEDLMYPLFVYHGQGLRREIPSMPGQYQLSLDRLGEAVAEVAALGIPAVLLFGIPEHKDATGSAASLERGIVQDAVRLIKRQAPELLVITDVCFCEYTDHGHCGPLTETAGRVDVDRYQKARRGPKKPPTAKGTYRNGHTISTHRLLNRRHPKPP